MPELAEVETVRKQVAARMKGHTIKKVVADETDRWLFAHVKPREVVKALEGAKVEGAGRKGKYFWLELNRKPWPIFKSLHKAVLSVVKKAVSADADYERFPKSWLFHERWGKSKNAKTSTGKKIIHEEIGGRTTAWVPGHQK